LPVDQVRNIYELQRQSLVKISWFQIFELFLCFFEFPFEKGSASLLILDLQGVQIAMSIMTAQLVVDLPKRIPDVEELRRELLLTESQPRGAFCEIILVVDKIAF
jgi:hypothetical protein